MQVVDAKLQDMPDRACFVQKRLLVINSRLDDAPKQSKLRRSRIKCGRVSISISFSTSISIVNGFVLAPLAGPVLGVGTGLFSGT
jgi:hypothetical protein